MDDDQSCCSFLQRALKGGQGRRHHGTNSFRSFRFYQPQLGVWAWNKEVHFQSLLIAKIVELLAHPAIGLAFKNLCCDEAHGITTQHDGLAVYGDFRKVAEPRELLGQLANLLVVIAWNRKDLLAANLLALLQSSHLAPDAEIPKEIEDVIGLSGVVETVEDRSIHFLDALKRSITVADYVAMPEMKIRREQAIRRSNWSADMFRQRLCVPGRRLHA